MGKTTIKSSKDLLWENPSPTSTFASTTLNIDWAPYKFILILSSIGNSTGTNGHIIHLMDTVQSDVTYNFSGRGGGVNERSLRTCKLTSSGIYFGSGINPGTETGDKYMVPIRIYGIK